MSGLILECDIGNSRCKWRLLSANGSIIDQGCTEHAQGFADLSVPTIVERVRVACVAGDHIVRQFTERISHYGIEPEFAVSTPAAAGVSCAYGRHAASLGVDRWLAVVAAYQRRQGAALVIDVGSALTADLVTADGQHLGGYILPGAALMKNALFADTDVRFAPKDHTAGLAYGCSTADAVQAGVLASQVGAITVAITEAKRRISEDFAILLTGGGAASMADYLQCDVVEVPDLVLDGLRWLLP